MHIRCKQLKKKLNLSNIAQIRQFPYKYYLPIHLKHFPKSLDTNREAWKPKKPHTFSKTRIRTKRLIEGKLRSVTNLEERES